MTELFDVSSIDVLLAILFAGVVLAILYVFYPALSMSKTRSHVTERVVSKVPNQGAANDGIILSIVIPAYNEEDRLPIMLDAALASITKHRRKIVELAQAKSQLTSRTAFEWIVVSDGSTDGTSNVVEKYGRASSEDVWKLVTLHTNSGKGTAVRIGMLAASGAMRLMVDADGATDFDALVTLLNHCCCDTSNNNTSVVVFGSRAHLASQAQRSFIRTMLMHAFHLCVEILVGSNIQDTQCGFKLFTSDAADLLFSNLHLQRWAFDIELVVLASRLNLNIAEVGVPWQEVEGSKLDSSKFQLAIVALGMLRDMLCVRLCYMWGIWKVRRSQQDKKER